MDEILIKWSPVIILVIGILIQNRIFVTPEQLEKKHREILEDAEKKFALLSTVSDLKEQFCDMKDKIDKIYDFIINSQK